MSELLELVASSIMLSQRPGLDFDKHSVYETQGVQGRETESEEEAHLLRGFCFVLLLRPHAECE